MNAVFAQKPKPAVSGPSSSHIGLVQRQCSCSGGCDADGLTVSHPDDAYEQEADRVAAQVMRMPAAGAAELPASDDIPVISGWTDSLISRQTEDDEQDVGSDVDDDPSSIVSAVSRKEASGGGPRVTPGVAVDVRSLRGGGQHLPAQTRDFFEPRFHHDFSDVRIHTDARATQTSRSLDARAFTVGSDIAFAPGEFRPETEAGRLLLAHELTHVVQQGSHVRTLMRACNCPAAGASAPTTAQHTFLSGLFPRLKADSYCVTGPKTPTYNCIAWSIGSTSKWVWDDVDAAGNKNGTVEYSDFDAFYGARGLTPVIGKTPANPLIALYGTSSEPKHAALKTGAACGSFESKLGANVRIAHSPVDLEGGSSYGDINRYYV